MNRLKRLIDVQNARFPYSSENRVVPGNPNDVPIIRNPLDPLAPARQVFVVLPDSLLIPFVVELGRWDAVPGKHFVSQVDAVNSIRAVTTKLKRQPD